MDEIVAEHDFGIFSTTVRVTDETVVTEIKPEPHITIIVTEKHTIPKDLKGCPPKLLEGDMINKHTYYVSPSTPYKHRVDNVKVRYDYPWGYVLFTDFYRSCFRPFVFRNRSNPIWDFHLTLNDKNYTLSTIIRTVYEIKANINGSGLDTNGVVTLYKNPSFEWNIQGRAMNDDPTFNVMLNSAHSSNPKIMVGVGVWPCSPPSPFLMDFIDVLNRKEPPEEIRESFIASLMLLLMD